MTLDNVEKLEIVVDKKTGFQLKDSMFANRAMSYNQEMSFDFGLDNIDRELASLRKINSHMVVMMMMMTMMMMMVMMMMMMMVMIRRGDAESPDGVLGALRDITMSKPRG